MQRAWGAAGYPIWNAATRNNPSGLSDYWRGALAAMPKKLREELANIPPQRADAVFAEHIAELAQDFLSRRQHAAADAPLPAYAGAHRIIFRSGGMALLYYPPKRLLPRAAPFFLVPSLINRSYIMDFSPSGLVATLTQGGHGCYLADFSSPKGEERAFTCEDYVLRRLLPAALHAMRHGGASRMIFCGYCMGGALAAGLAAQLPKKRVAGLAMFGAPWNFSRVIPAFREPLQAMAKELAAAPGNAPVPGEWIAAMFYGLYWPSVIRRLERGEESERQARLDGWLNDGVDMAAPTAAETIGWLGNNLPMRGKWTIGGKPFVPRRFSAPTWICAGKRDAVVPLSASLPALRLFKRSTLCLYPGGHAGMMTEGPDADACRKNLAEWAKSS